MKITIDPSVLTHYPQAAIGYLVADVNVEKSHPYVETLKAGLENHVRSLGITAKNISEHPDINCWRRIYRDDFGVKASDFRSSIEALVRRVLRGEGIWEVSSIVDLYNCCSVLCLLPMGAYDLKKVQGDIYLRYGQEGEKFLPLASQDSVAVQNRHIVYADQEKILCWLWNHRDSRLSGIDFDTRKAIFFVDTASKPETCSANEGVQTLVQHVERLGATQCVSGVLNAASPVAEIDL